MIIQESKLVRNDMPAHSEFQNYSYVEGYFLTIDDLAKLVLDFETDYHSIEIANTKSYIEDWLKNHNQLVKK